jgi:hypothetical protein
MAPFGPEVCATRTLPASQHVSCFRSSLPTARVTHSPLCAHPVWISRPCFVQAIVIDFFENDGGQGLQVSWSGPGVVKRAIPSAALRCITRFWTLCRTGTFQNNVGQAACLPCPQGASCPFAGMISQSSCAVGWFQDLPNQASCKPCTAGSFCSTAGLSVPNGACPAGSFSMAGASSPSCTPCSAGQMQPVSGQSSCVACPAGSFCSTAGLLAPTGNCSAGSYSSGGAASASCTPCPTGSFCPSPAMSAATTCPEGSFCPSVSLRAATPCTPGMYCAGTGLTAVSGSCAAGSYSSGGAATSACMTCAAGQYQDTAAQASCKPCPAGAYCLSTWSQIQGDSQGLRARWYKYSSILYSLPPSAELESQAPTVQTFVPNLDYAAVDNAAIGGLNAVSGGLLDRYATRFDGCGCL